MKLFIAILLSTFLGSFVTSSFAQSCKVDIISMEAKIKAQPESVLFALGDAIALRPDCIGDLIEAAVKASGSKSGAVSEIVKLAVSEYPEKASTIAESAVIASPENVDVIRKAFEAAKNGTYKPKYHKNNLPDNPSPIEKFLANYQTSKPYDPNDVANKGLAAIDRILEKIKNNQQPGVEPDAAAPKESALVAQPVEEFKMVKLEPESISTINDPLHHDNKDELLTVEEKPLVIEDPKGPNLAEILKEKAIEREAEKRKKEEALAARALVKNSLRSSVYHIPSAADSIPLISGRTTVLRSRSASQTLPHSR